MTKRCHSSSEAESGELLGRANVVIAVWSAGRARVERTTAPRADLFKDTRARESRLRMRRFPLVNQYAARLRRFGVGYRWYFTRRRRAAAAAHSGSAATRPSQRGKRDARNTSL